MAVLTVEAHLTRRWRDLAASVPLGRLSTLRLVQYLPHYLPRDPGPVALSPPACPQQCGGGSTMLEADCAEFHAMHRGFMLVRRDS